MKRLVALLACCIAITGLYVMVRHPSQKPSHPDSALPHDNVTNPSPASNRHNVEIRPSSTSTPLEKTTVTSVAPDVEKPTVPFLLGSPNAASSISPDIVLGNMRNVIRQYGSMFGANPVGTNPEITEVLNGGNPKEARFINEESGLRINGRGELVDSWGTPFFFHQLSATEMEIRSAGPDLKMWTRDDLVTK
jgi:hypothetical protein